MQVVFESPRIASSDTVIYTDRIPKNMYEYFINGYKEADIETLITNMQMPFESWDKSCNLYKSSNSLMELSEGDITVLFEDLLGNQFIYASAKKRIFYYQPEQEPYVDINKGITIAQFLELARADFNALMRTSYGKKYITEATVMTEGLKEFFGYGKALRIFIDGRNAKKSDRYAIDKHSYAFIDALDDYSPNFIDKSEFNKIINHPNTVVEIYDNHKLGRRDALRRMPVKEEALLETRNCTLVDLAKEFDQDLADLYRDYKKAKSFKMMVKAAKPRLDAFLKKNPLMKAAYVLKYDDYDDFLTLDQMYNLPLLTISEYSNYSYVASFDVGKFKRAFIASINNRFQKFNNSDIVDKFLANVDYLLDMFESCDSMHIWHFYGTMKPLTESEVRNDCKGLCCIKATTYPAMKDTVFAAPPPEPAAQQYLKNVNTTLYEYMTGYKFDVLESDLLKHRLDIEYGNPDRVIEEVTELTTSEINDFLDQEFHKELLDNFLTDEMMEATMYYVAIERELGRSIAHNVRAGVEKVGNAASNVARNVKSVVGPIMDKAKNLIDGIQKSREEDDREIAITDSDFAKLRRFFKETGLPTVASYFVLGPAWAVVTFMVSRALKSDDKKTRDKVVRELEEELKLTREKIEDSRSDGNKQAKYALMRLESKLEKQIAEVKYGLR